MIAALAACLFAFAPLPEPARSAVACEWMSPPAASEAERQLLEDCRDGRLDRHSLLQAALLAGGASDDEAARHLQWFASLCAEVRGQIDVHDSHRQKAESLLSLLHRRVLVGEYRLSATSLSEAFERGNYNCVSATILYQCLAAECGLTCRAIGLPEHAFNRVVINGDGTRVAVDVESTSRYGLHEARPTNRGDSNPGAHERELSDVQLLAAVYYNRGHSQLSDKRYPEALAANSKAVQLDPLHRAARDNLLATVNNWALHLAESGDLAAALDLLAYGERLAPEHQAFRINRRLLSRQPPAAASTATP